MMMPSPKITAMETVAAAVVTKLYLGREGGRVLGREGGEGGREGERG